MTTSNSKSLLGLRAALTLLIVGMAASVAFAAGPRTRTHVVQAGETLSHVASRYRTTLDELKGLNHIANDDHVIVGQRLHVPLPAFVKDAQVQVVDHTVAHRETLTNIAERYRTSVRAIRQLNNLRGDRLVVGQQIAVPTVGPVARRVPFTYTVKRGDSLNTIAVKHGLAPRAIRRLNPKVLWRTLLAGRQVKLYREVYDPAPPEAPAPVQPGEPAEVEAALVEALAAQPESTRVSGKPIPAIVPAPTTKPQPRAAKR